VRTEPDDPLEPTTEHPRKKARLLIATVAAAVLLAGGGSAWWATARNDATHGGAEPLRMDGPGLTADAKGGPAPVTGDGAMYQLTGKLPEGPGGAPVYRASGAIPRSAVQHLATLLGVTGTVTSDHDSWRVGGADGGPALLVGKSAPGTWSYTRSGPAPVTAVPDGSNAGSAPANPAPGGSGTDSGTPAGSAPVSEAAAKAAAQPVLTGLGLSGAAVDAAQTVGAERTVTADPEVGGLPTHGWQTSLQIGPDGRLSLGYGRLSALTKGATYPVVSAATALKELNARPVMHPDYGVESCVRPLAGSGGGSADGSGSAPDQGGAEIKPASPTDKKLPPSLPCVPNNGHPTQVRGASFGLALEYVDGAQTLVPAWLFDTAPAGVTRTAVVAQTAVDPSYIRTGPGSTGTLPPPAPPSVNPGGPEVSPSPASPPLAKRDHRVALDSYASNGSTLTLTFMGGVCDTYAASASESDSKVTVTVIATPKKAGAMCPAIARSFTAQVTLDKPLDGRTVVDAKSGQPLRGR